MLTTGAGTCTAAESIAKAMYLVHKYDLEQGGKTNRKGLSLFI